MSVTRTILWITLVCSPLWFARVGAAAEIDVKDLFEKISQTRRELDFRGVMRYWRGNEVSSLAVAHRYVHGVEQERLIAREGKAREILRRDEVLLCYLPGGEMILRPEVPGISFLTGLRQGKEVSAAHYAVSQVGTERQAGYLADKLMVMAADSYRYSHLLWLERDSSLLIKSMTLDAAGNALERFEFDELELRPRFDEAEFAGLGRLDAPLPGGVEGSAASVSDPTAEPVVVWSVAWLPPGFVPLAASGVSGEGFTGSVSFADGVTGFSVFVEPLLAGAMPEGSSMTGATGAVTRHLRDVGLAVTVVGEVPLVSAVKVADNVRHLGPTGK